MRNRPGLGNACVAILTMLINIYTAQEGYWSITAIVSLCIAGSYGLLMGASYATSQFLIVRRLKQEQ